MMADTSERVTANSPYVAYFPFDGTCKCSRDGDVFLTFDDDTWLKTHSALLKMASAVFNTLLTDCKQEETVSLSLEGTCRATWIRILNHLHPSAALILSSFDPVQDVQLLADLMNQARKFELYSLFSFMDAVTSSNFPGEMPNPIRDAYVTDVQHAHIQVYDLVLQFELELPKTSELVRAHIIKFLLTVSSKNGDFHRRAQQRLYAIQSGYLTVSANQSHRVLSNKHSVMKIIENGSYSFYKKLVKDLMETFFF